MQELIEAAKAVIDLYDYTGPLDECEAVNRLSDAVDRAENPPADYNEWTWKNSGRVLPAYEVWIAAQQAERERIKGIVQGLITQSDPWIHFSTLLEKIDASDYS